MKKFSFFWVLLYYLFFPLFRHATLWLPAGWGGHYLHGDVYTEYWPDLSVLSHYLRAGEWPLWDPYVAFGFPLVGDIQSGGFYPLAWPYLLWDSLFGPSLWAFEIFTLSAVMIWGLGIHVYLRAQGISTGAALLAGTVGMSGGFLRFFGYLKFMHTLAWLPWALLLWDRWYERPTWRSSVGFGMLLGVAACSGAPGGLFYVGLTLGIYAVFRILQRLGKKGAFASWRHVFFGGVALTWFVGLFLVLAVPTVAFLQGSGRAAGYSFMAARAHWPHTWGGLWFPRLDSLAWIRPDGTLHYNGLLVWFILPFAFWASLRLRKLAVFFAALGVLGLLFAAGSATFGIDLLYTFVPGAHLFRAPERYSFLFNLSAAMLVGIGVDTLWKHTKEQPSLVWRRLAWYVWAGLFVWLGLLIAYSVFRPRLQVLLEIARNLGIWGAFVFLAYQRGRKKLLWFFPVWLLVVILDVSLYFNFSTIIPSHSLRTMQSPLLKESPRGPLASYRVMNDYENASDNVSHFLQVRSVYAYPNPLLPKRYREVMAQVTAAPEILAFFNVERYLASTKKSGTWGRSMRSRASAGPMWPWLWRVGKSQHGIQVYHLQKPIPRIHWVPRLVGVTRNAQTWEVMRYGDPWWVATVEVGKSSKLAFPWMSYHAWQASLGVVQPKPKKAAPWSQVDRLTAPRKMETLFHTRFRLRHLMKKLRFRLERQREGGGVRARLRRWEQQLQQNSSDKKINELRREKLPSYTITPIVGGHNELSTTMTTKRSGFVVLNETCSPHWKVSVNGRSVRTFRVNHLLCGVSLPAGKHRLRFVFSFPSYRWLFGIWWVFFLGGGVILAWPTRKTEEKEPLA
ncbi:MAG: YfhO family protein [Myxococcales bacterium]|nr:YfhO family protein [Myxococcales bacterium]